MKLRLPHKFQAALMAALASVSFTTLSTGTAAYAVTLEDAALKMYDFTQATVDKATADGWTFSDTTIGSTGIYTTDEAWGTITHDGAWTTYESNKKRSFFAALLTFNVKEGLATNGVLLEAQGASSKVEGIGYTSSNGIYKVGSAWTGGYRSQGLIDQDLANYADANGLVTVAIIYKGDATPGGCAIFMDDYRTDDTGLKGTDDPNGNPTMYLASSKGVQYTNLYLFGMSSGSAISNDAMVSMMKTAAAYYWNGSAGATWTTSSTNWNHYGSNLGVTIGEGNANTNVVFGADGVKTVAVEGSITVGDMAVESAGYAFNMANDARLTVAGTASIDHTIQVTGGTLTLNGQIDVDTGIGLSNYDVHQVGTITYTDGTNGGFISANTTQYTLVKGTNTTVDGSYTFADAGVAKVAGADGLVFTYNPTTPAGVYYILASQSYDATKMDAATEFMVQGNNVEFTAAGIQLAGKALTLGAGTIWKTGSGGNFNNQQVQKLTLLGNAKVNPANNGGIIGASDGETFLDLQGHTLTIASSSNHFALFNTTALSSGTISIDDNRFLQIGHSQKTSTARLNDVVLNFGGANAHLTIDCNSTLTVEGLTGNGTIQRDGGSTPTLILAPTLENASYTFTGKFTTTAKLVMDKASTGTQAINVSTASTIDSIAVHGGTLSIGGTAALTVNNGVTVDGGTLDLGNRQHTGISALTINEGGLVTTQHSGNAGCVSGTITINAGGTFQVIGNNDAFGYDANVSTTKIVMNGTEGKVATLALDNTNTSTASVTMRTNIEMNGYSEITSKKTGFNSWGGSSSITATGTHNTIEQFEIRSNATINVVNAADELTVETMRNGADSTKILTKAGAGTLTFSQRAQAAGYIHNAGTTVFDCAIDVAGAVTVAGGNVGLQAAGGSMGTLTVNGGSVSVGADGGAEVSGLITVGTGGTLTNAGELTLNGLTLDGSFTNTGSLTLGGTVTLATGNSIVNNTGGTVALDNSVAFDLTHLQATNQTYTLFTGSAGVNLTSLNGEDVLSHITGSVVTTGRSWSFTNDGKLTYTVNSRNLMWSSYVPDTWTSENDNVTPWSVYQVPGTTYFHNGDSVTFSYVTGDEQATLGSDVTVATMTLDGSAGNVTVNNAGTHSFNVDELDILGGRLTTNTAITVKIASIASGAEWSLGGALDLDSVTTFSNNGLLRVLSGVELRVHKGTTAESIGTVTADAGGTLYVENGSGTGDSKYTCHGSADDPFMGTLVYDINSTPGHNTSIALENFQGTLELRGRLDANDSSFGGMTKLVLRGDRANNTTGLYSHGSALTLDADVDIVGPNQVDLYTSSALTINGDINADGAAGILGKRDGSALNLNGDVNLLGLNIYQNAVNLNGTGKDYNLGAVTLNGGNLAVGATGVGSLTATDLIVIHPATLSSAAANPTVFDVTNFDVSNYNTNFTLQNVTLNVSGAATAAVLNTAQNVDQATVTVGDKATLNLDGSVVWKKVDEKDATKTDYVNLTIANGGEAHVNGGEHNILNNVTLNHGGSLSFDADTTTEIAGTLALADTITNAGTVTINSGSVAANQVGTLSGSGAYTIKGTVAATGTLKLNGTTVTGAGTEAAPAALTGNVDINGGTIGGTLNIGSSGSTVSVLNVFDVAEGASLFIAGPMVLDALEEYATVSYTEGQGDTQNNGFINGVQVQVFDPGAGSEILFGSSAQVTYKGAQGICFEDGYFRKTGTSYATFFVNTSGTTESLDHALTVAEAASGTVTTVQLANGTTLDMDHADAALQHLVLKEGASATLNVTQSATISSVEGLGTAQALTVTGTAGKVLAISTTETVAGMLSVTGATLKLDTNLTLAGGLDNNGTISMEGKTLTLNGTTAYNLGNVTGNDQSYITVGNNATAVVDGNVTVRRVYGNAGSNIEVEEGAALNLLTTGRSNYSEIHGDLDIKGTVSFKSNGGDMRFWGTSDNQVFNLGHLVVDGGTGQVDLLTAGDGNYTSTIAAKSLSGGSSSHILEVTTCYTGGTAGTGKVVNFVIGDGNSTATAASYTGTIKYGVGSGSVKAGGGMNLVIKDEYVAADAVLETIMGGGTYGTVTVDTERAKVKGLKDATSGKTVNVSGTAADKNRVLEIVGNDNYTYNGKLGANLDVVHSGSGTQSFGGVDGFNGSIDVEAGVLNILNAASVNVHDITINNATLGVYNSGTATADTSHEGTLTIKNGQKLTAAGTATLNANLVMTSGSTLDVSATNGAGLLMGSSVTLNPWVTLSAGDMAAITDLGFMDQYTLFTGVDAFSYDGSTPTSTPIAFDSETWVKASEVFSNSEFTGGKDYYVFYSGAQNGSNVGAVYVMQLPEPTTGTLSLLALCALAARRRRK